MKKLNFLLGVLAIVICLTGCNKESEELPTLSKNEVAAIESVKNELSELNVTYRSNLVPQTRIPKWLRWVIFGAADAAGAVFGGVSGACAASTLAWTVTKAEVSKVETTTTQEAPASAIKSDNLINIENGSIGYVHNVVIANTMVNNSDIYSKSSEDVLDIVLTELGNQTGTVISESQKADIISNTTRIVNSFDANKTVEEYYNELIQQTSDLKQKEALEICSIVLDGLQYVDDNDTSYIENATAIVKNSDLEPELKATLLDGISVANASVKLWNTDEISDVKLQ